MNLQEKPTEHKTGPEMSLGIGYFWNARDLITTLALLKTETNYR